LSTGALAGSTDEQQFEKPRKDLPSGTPTLSVSESSDRLTAAL